MTAGPRGVERLLDLQDVDTRLDRLARSTLHLCQIAAELARKQVHLQVLDQQITTCDATGRLVFHMLGAIAQFETAVQAEAPESTDYKQSVLSIGQSYFMLSQAPKAIPWLEKVPSSNEANYMRQAFYPLTLPLTVGPGSIAVAITVGTNRPGGSEWRWPLIAGMLIGALLIAIAIYLSYRFADRIAAVMGESAMNVLIRLSSFILVCIGVQIAWNGLSTLLRSLLTR